MSDIKLIKNLNMGEVEKICKNSDECAECPLLISSYNKNIHCLKDDTFPIYEVEKIHKKMNMKIDLDTYKIVKEEEE